VGLECELDGGMVCVFDIRGSKVLRAVQMPSKVCELHLNNVLIAWFWSITFIYIDFYFNHFVNVVK
jgi:hypothetical protein